MSEDEKIEEGPELVDDEPETEWVGADEWGDEEDEGVALVEDEVPSYVDNGDGTIGDTRASLMWKKDDSFKSFGYGINWFEAQDYCEELNEKNSQVLMTGDFPAAKKLKAFFLLRSPIPIRMVQKPMFLTCSKRVAVITLGPTKKNRTTSSMPRNSALLQAMICGSIRTMSILIVGLLVT
jgi:hypothetical protein